MAHLKNVDSFWTLYIIVSAHQKKKKVLFSNLGAPNSLKSGIVSLCKPLCRVQPLLQAFELVVLIFHSPRVCYDSPRSESESLKNCSAINAAPQALEAKKIHGPTKGILRSNAATPIHQSTKNILEDSTVSKSKILRNVGQWLFASGQPPVRVMFWYLDSTKTALQIPLICEELGWVGTQLDLKGVRFRLCEICAKQWALQSLFCLGVKCVFCDRFRLVLTPITAN